MTLSGDNPGRLHERLAAHFAGRLTLGRELPRGDMSHVFLARESAAVATRLIQSIPSGAAQA